MRHLKLSGLILSVLFLFNACQSTSSKWDLQPLDLTSHGLPIIIQAPDSAEIVPNVMAFEKGVTITQGDFMIEVELKDKYADKSKNVDSILSKKIASIESKSNFDQFLLNKSNGFIYSTNDTIIGLDHHFYLVGFKNGKQFEFKEAPNVMANYTFEEIKALFEAVELALK